jgi:branched-chain amino acid transport system substrate-binding protein
VNNQGKIEEERFMRRRTLLASAGALAALGRFGNARADTPGVTATEIKIGNTWDTGPASPYATEAKGQAAVFRMINDKGGINGRRITFISWDDGSDPHRTVELTRRLVEEEQVAFLFHSSGTPTQLAVRDYMNSKGVPQLFVGSIRDIFGDPEHYHWTMAFPPSLRTEAAILWRISLEAETRGEGRRPVSKWRIRDRTFGRVEAKSR